MFLNDDIFNKLDDNEKKLIERTITTGKFVKGQIINRSDKECKGLMKIKKGIIRVYVVSDEGKEITLYRLSEGDYCILSASCVLDAILFDVIIEAFEDTIVDILPSSSLNFLKKQNINFENFLLKMTNERFSEVMWTLQSLLFLGLDQRLINFLWDELIKNNCLELSYTHEEIAKLIGSSREVVTRMLKHFNQEGIVFLKRGKIIIKDKNLLKNYVT